MIAEVIINSNVKNLNKTFDYNIPFEMEDKVNIGSRVLVKFGNIKQLEEGFVVNIKDKSDWDNLKDIGAVEEKDFIDEPKIELAKWMAHRYFCNVSDCIKLMLPPGTGTKDVAKRVKEKCVNSVGVNINTASPSLLKYVSGITKKAIEKIIEYREKIGKITSRDEIKKKKLLQCI